MKCWRAWTRRYASSPRRRSRSRAPPLTTRTSTTSTGCMAPSKQTLVTVRGVRAEPGGRVMLWSTKGGWVVYPDLTAVDRRWTAWGLFGLALIVVGAIGYRPGWGAPIAIVGLVIAAVAMPLAGRAARKGRQAYRQAYNQSARVAGQPVSAAETAAAYTSSASLAFPMSPGRKTRLVINAD